MEDAAAALIPGMTEIEAAAEVAAACRRRGLFAPVILAAGDDRIGRFRHPVSSSARFHRRAMLVVCAERGGTYANMTQFVHFEEPDRDWLRQRDATETILRRLREEATKPGRSLGEIFADAVRYYREAGFPDEWMHHHQGGMTGYATREVVATPESDVDVQTGMAFAWNPSVQGAKSEETFVLTGGEPVVLAPVAVSGATTALW
jgi:antitoxin VapB